MLYSSAHIRREAEDLQRKKEAAEALCQQVQTLAHHQWLKTIGTLTASIAHEFNHGIQHDGAGNAAAGRGGTLLKSS